MTHAVPPASPPDDSCRRWRRRLRDLEREVARGLKPTQANEAVAETLREMQDHLRHCASCARRQRRRLDALRARWALRCREIPGGLLDGFYDAVRQATAHVPPGGAMSLAFLDAPRSLRTWRRIALAASLLLAVGATYVLTDGRGTPRAMEADGGIALHDARDGLLEAWDSAPRALPPARGVLVRPVAAGERSFFRPAARKPRLGPGLDSGMPQVEARWD